MFASRIPGENSTSNAVLVFWNLHSIGICVILIKKAKEKTVFFSSTG